MKIKNILGAILLILGVYLLFSLYQSSLPIIYGTRAKANIIGTDSVKNKRFTYLYYPVFQFNYQNQLIKFTDKSSSVDKDIEKSEVMVYYDQNYGFSQGFTTEKIIFLIISILLILFGSVCLVNLSDILMK
ncbi:hypothetical protein [Chryseobacterium rhizosphaerae]|uniref:hypothetical protein n=1 Tax=Chryseobacterium rhizosphaerae TaxID=395937 RepID=UPI0023594B49|nr:hypothetical protein [Chryseobacterium rhizosphaerae]MDC8100512.1 hypothetical protein [Chryseobacterium rhizosphaerae]